MIRTAFIILLVSFLVNGYAAHPPAIIVAQTGKADFRSIQAAINSLPQQQPGNPEPRVILIKNGVYNEKIYIEKNNLVLEGEDKNKTIITQSIARDEWRCMHTEDWGAATVNVDGNDICFKNLTVLNDYGFKNISPTTIICKADSNHQKTVRRDGHQMALRTMNATRLKAINCIFKAYGGDTVSPWNVDEGMFYFKDCYMEGGVDFYCPRGWAWAEGCTFFANTGDASIWHDGSGHPDAKTVLVNCYFDGYKGFKLGRYHRDAQFFLINCSFSENMADKAIYQVPTNNTIQWGERIYYQGCHRDSGDYTWFADNINLANLAGIPDIFWLFGNRWNPAK